MAKLSKKVEQLLAELVPKPTAKAVTAPQKRCALHTHFFAQCAPHHLVFAVIKKLVNEKSAKAILALMEEENADMAYASAVISLIRELIDKRDKQGAAKTATTTNAASKVRAQRGRLQWFSHHCTTASWPYACIAAQSQACSQEPVVR